MFFCATKGLTLIEMHERLVDKEWEKYQNNLNQPIRLVMFWKKRGFQNVVQLGFVN
jgi:hypothetical protein